MDKEDLEQAIRAALIRGLEPYLTAEAHKDANLSTPANITDALYAIAEALYAVAGIER